MALFKKKNYIRINPNRSQAPANKTDSARQSFGRNVPDVNGPYIQKKWAQKSCVLIAAIISVSVPGKNRINDDEKSLEEWDTDVKTEDPLNFPDYLEKIASVQEKTRLHEAVLTGEATINQQPVAMESWIPTLLWEVWELS